MTLVSVQYLRGMAALMVVYFHIAYQWSRASGHPIGFPASLGSAGVDVFFVISGLIMWITTAGGRMGPAGFMTKRITRIVPIYWLLTLLLTAVAVARPDLLSTTKFDPAHLIASLLFVPWQHPNYAVDNPMASFAPVIIPGWTLNYEMAFYLLFALFLLVPMRRRFISVTSTLILVVLAGYLLEPGGRLKLYSDPIILEFCFGIVIGRIYTSAFVVAPIVSIGLMTAGMATLLLMGIGGDLPRIISWGLPAAMIVAGAVLGEKNRGIHDFMPLRLLGDASYSLYLTHVFTLTAATKAWMFVTSRLYPGALTGMLGSANGIFFAVFSFVAAIAAGVAFYKWVEAPIIGYFRKRGRNGPFVAGRSAGGQRTGVAPMRDSGPDGAPPVVPP
jgi:exopolysaccharide production protein ExoZ